jgi:CRP/FNR family transcriptional regulator
MRTTTAGPAMNSMLAAARPLGAAPADAGSRVGLLEVELADDAGLWTRHRVRKNTCLARAGSLSSSLFVVRLGCFKAAMMGADAHEHVVDFPMRGDWLGTEALAGLPWSSDVVALDDSEVLVLPLKWFEDTATRVPRLRADLYRHHAQALWRDRRHMMQLSVMSARQRVAHFLLYLSERFAAGGYSSRSFMLPMLRADIGSYLGIALESVSRAFSDLYDQGMIKVRLRDIELLDPDGLQRIAQAPAAIAKPAARTTA